MEYSEEDLLYLIQRSEVKVKEANEELQFYKDKLSALKLKKTSDFRGAVLDAKNTK